MKLPALLLVSCMLAGCAGTTPATETVQPQQQSSSGSSGWAQLLRAAAGPGPGLAAHDPAPDTPLFSQIPSWNDAAQRRCCSVLPRAEFIQARCDTDAPLGGRTNRC